LSLNKHQLIYVQFIADVNLWVCFVFYIFFVNIFSIEPLENQYTIQGTPTKNFKNFYVLWVSQIKL